MLFSTRYTRLALDEKEELHDFKRENKLNRRLRVLGAALFLLSLLANGMQLLVILTRASPRCTQASQYGELHRW